MGISPASFWANLFSEEEFMSSLIFSVKINARQFLSTKHVIDDF